MGMCGPRIVRHFKQVEGALAKRNDVLHVERSSSNNPQNNVVFFPGDVQTFQQDMEQCVECPSLTHTDKQARKQVCDLIHYSLENTALKLAQKFPQSNIWVISPARHMVRQSHFDHLLHAGHGIAHLRLLLLGAAKLAKQHKDDGSCARGDGEVFPELCTFTLCGFSKGGLVLNNFLSEVASLTYSLRASWHTRHGTADDNGEPREMIDDETAGTNTPAHILDWEDPSMAPMLPPHHPPQRIARARVPVGCLDKQSAALVDFISRVTRIHFLDAFRFPTSPAVVRGFLLACSRSPIEAGINSKSLYEQGFIGNTDSLFIHSTPRQLADRRRRWIKVEHDAFVDLLQETRGNAGEDGNEGDATTIPTRICDIKYFEDEKPSMDMHFRIIDHFLVA
eukprot:TRINITY_DN319_c0_g2_i1.p1 TRINITY_DN319_c0_g2~~TRINITY_DN319_c0_g2_i1.p1  ORF type:complete len:394 (+),score=24.78 TRINITY_DN319_c0_g2_i1:153-1334(+)